MGRLTKRIKDDVVLKKYDAACARFCGRIGSCTNCGIDEAFRKLAEYEDTGFEPEAIVKADKEYELLSKEVRELREKQTPKKPELSGDGYADGFPVYDA